MIVKDEQENLPHCLGSVAGLFDEIVGREKGTSLISTEEGGEKGHH